MPRAGFICLMYHELERAGRPLCCNEPGYVRYVVREADFLLELQSLAAAGTSGQSLSKALESSQDGLAGVAITFDDGCETDWLVAAPVLKQLGFGATFYVVAAWIGQRGYLTMDQLHSLAGDGFEIGCHSMTHAYLTGLDAASLQREIAASKDCLEQITGKRVEHFSCPGGRWNAAVSECCRKAGYRSVATSRIGINRAAGGSFRLARVAVQRDTALPAFESLCRGNGLWMPQARQALLDSAKAVVGNSTYERIRAGMLDRR
ncbi:MAG: polysaccharide deacetylase family protein [Terriglobia bacterium]